MDNFVQITTFCPPEPRVDVFVYRNTGKVYRIGQALKRQETVLPNNIAVNNTEHPARNLVACVLCCLPLKKQKAKEVGESQSYRRSA